jgi:hypothetical protein
VLKSRENEPREKQAVVGLVMRAILISFVVAVTASSALAENDQALGERISQVVRDEWDRQDCLWRETLRLTRLKNGTALTEIAGVVAYSCSEKIRRQILQGATAAHDMKEMAAYDQIAAQERALSVGRQLKALDETDRSKAPN